MIDMPVNFRANSSANVAFTTPSPKNQSRTYTAILLPLFNSGRIVLPKSDRLVNQLSGLERRTARSGKDSIDHAPGTHDDFANAVAGAADSSSHSLNARARRASADHVASRSTPDPCVALAPAHRRDDCVKHSACAPSIFNHRKINGDIR